MDNKKYYEGFNWESVDKEMLGSFLVIISASMPNDVKNILDVGCGNGVLTNELSKTYNVTGVDRSEQALAFVKTDKICASADDIPVADQSFDLVLSTEMIEHLEDDTLSNTIEEFKRISKKYILITVPNNEDIDKLVVKCPSCGYIFNLNYHLQKISQKDLLTLFPEYDIIKYELFGAMVRTYKPWLSGIKRKYAPSSAWIPFFWKFSNDRSSLCPNCEQTFSYPYKFNLLALTADALNIVISSKKPYYQLCLFAKRDKFITKD